jgi:pyrimidine operon attenuation protein/uracil phosphoribosyltransferase
LDPSLTEASVNITLYRDGNSVGSATGTTNSDGVVAFSLKNASSGHYTTIVDSVISNGDSLSVTTDDIDDNGNLGFQK